MAFVTSTNDNIESLQRPVHHDSPVDIDKEERASASPNDTDLETAKASTEIGWGGPQDQGNPQNWSTWKKVFHTAIPALYGFVATVATSAYVPALPILMVKYHIQREVATLPLSIYLLGFTIGPLAAAPLSEIYGRRPVYWSTLPLLMIFTAASGVSNSIALMTVMRLLAGIGGSGALAIGAGTIADVWDHKDRGKAAVSFVMAPFLGPVLGPLIGAYIISEYDNWRFSMWVVLFIAAPIAIASLFMEETLKSRILQQREKKVGIQVPRQTIDFPLLIGKLTKAFIIPLHMMFVEPLVALLSIYTGFAFAMVFSFFDSYNYVFQSIYHFNQEEVGLTFLGILIGFIFGIITFGAFDATLYVRASLKSNGMTAPEHRLYSAMLGSILLPIGLFWFAWAPQKDVHWIVPVLAGVPFGWGTFTIFISATTYLVDVYQGPRGASAVAANGILRYGFGAIFPLFTIQMYESMGIHWAGSVFAFVAVAMMPVPWIFFWKGKVLRAKSHYDTSRY